MITLLAFVVAIALLVLFHEFGHYLVARSCGVKVLRFSLGFGKVVYRKRFTDKATGKTGDTEWVISAIPLGGYVKMLDEREGKVPSSELKYAFNRQHVLKRIAIVVSGPLSNFLLAIALYWILFIHGMPGIKPVLGEVPAGSPAAMAQMQAGETILGIDGEAVPSWQDVRWKLLDRALQQGVVKIDGRSADGVPLSHLLQLGAVEAKDLDGEFLDKLGLRLYQPTIPPIIGKVVEDGLAQRAGLQEGDVILRANGVAMQRWNDVVEVVRGHPGQMVQLDIRRGETVLSVSVVPQADVEAGKTIGKIGAAPKVEQGAWQAMTIEVSYGPVDAFFQSLRKTWDTAIVSLKMLGKMVLGEISMRNLSGPITIADYAGQSAEMGMVAYLGFLALISISLGVLNLLPIPLLDGGHLLYYVAELVKGSPVSERTWEIGQNIGIALLGTLMIFAIYNDIIRLNFWVKLVALIAG